MVARLALVTCAAFALALLAGCTPRRHSIVEVFPPNRLAAPWILTGEVWSGTLDQAAPALGSDVDDWRPFAPTRVWLAAYQHQQRTDRTVTVRCFAFDSLAAAAAAYDAQRPAEAEPFQAGDAGCWTEVGVLFRDERLVWDLFGKDASWNSQVNAALLASYVTHRLTPALAADPQ